MATRQKPRVLAIASDETLDLVQEALGDLAAIVHYDLARLRREYGAAVAGEVLRQLVFTSRVRPSRRR
ncbi:MAG TPA: hypothetical protein VNO53_00520 [Steroidobacteraceae bacterium]|nr:hypothetical protein [Steroidobacteraceae bacterium]